MTTLIAAVVVLLLGAGGCLLPLPNTLRAGVGIVSQLIATGLVWMVVAPVLAGGEVLVGELAWAYPIGTLRVRLDALGGQLEELPDEASLFARIQAQASRLFAIRTEDTPSPVAQDRLARARAALANGQVERAISEVRQLPGAPLAQNWLRQAQAYADAQRALEVLEAASVAEPRTLQAAQINQAAQDAANRAN